MQRRIFMFRAASLAAAGLMAAGCRTVETTHLEVPQDKRDKRRREMEAAVDAALAHLYRIAPDSHKIIGLSAGVLVFPRVIGTALVAGGQYSEGALRIRNTTADYYQLTSLSAGLQLGSQPKAIIFAFLTQAALDHFHRSKSWPIDANAPVVVLEAGATGIVDTTQATQSIVAFVLTNTGLMANLTLEGTRVMRLMM
jgi:lipid-binding SYLF domain-containing protein